MNSKDIFVGTVKECSDIRAYKEYGEELYIPDFVLGKTEFGTTYKYVKVVDDKAVLIKVDEKNYIWLDMLESRMDEFLVNLGIAVKTIGTSPSCSGQLYVDAQTLEPYFEEEIDKLKVNHVRSLTSCLKR